MNKKNLVESYLNIFCSGKNFDELLKLFTENLVFQGPFINTQKASDYLLSLKQGESKEIKYDILYQFENENSFCCIYNLIKDQTKFAITQVFEFENDKISKILTIFDTNSM